MEELLQSRVESFVENLLSTGSGFILAYLSWLYLIPVVFEIETNPAQGLGITTFFTVLSIARGFLWRRYFNGRVRKRIHKWYVNV